MTDGTVVLASLSAVTDGGFTAIGGRHGLESARQTTPPDATISR